METGKTWKYLKYAVGEIILVVIGILIALQINNWNEERKINIEEQNALINLKEDFLYNTSQIDSLIFRTKRTVQANLKILEFTGKKSKPTSEVYFDSLVNFISATEQYFPRNGFLDDLINSGKLSIIKNENLRNKLSLWKPKLDNIYKKENSSLQFDYVLIDFVIKKGSWLNADETLIRPDIKFPVSGFDIDNRSLLDYPEFENMIENKIIFVNSLKAKLIEASQVLEEILVLINSEIK
ncbi:hypothetical protein CA834_10425 [Winogradskyella aurantia]|uniref:Uncharacterized protein n=2 Tax=Winogradskyella aurantia TaxID=1915063 RepID=A0A265URV9_9FLAO|nr:hypothetical protein CA834_10425 [Winogradskyella aurantia]